MTAESILIIIYWLTLFLILHTWLSYPGFLYVLNFLVFRDNSALDEGYRPAVSIIIAAHNEEKIIEERINNLLELDYPAESVEIIVASDGSTDNTNHIVKMLSDRNGGIKLVTIETQKGRAHAHNTAVQAAEGDILVFTDAETTFKQDFLSLIVRHFSDSRVGCVSGRLYYTNLEDSSITKSAGVYWKYEEIIRRLASNCNVMAFGTGAALAIRKSLYTPIEPDADIDYSGTLDVCLKGYVVRYETQAKAYDLIESDTKRSSSARIRKTSRAFKSILTKLLKINPFKRPFLFSSVFFHKTSRHLTPFYMLVLLVLSVALLYSGTVYIVLLVSQMLFYSLAFIGWILHCMNIKASLFYLPYNFVLINISRFRGVLKSVFGDSLLTYE